MNFWKDEEVKSLFLEVESAKSKGQALSVAFLNHAKSYGRKKNSVRNYYYKEVDNLSADPARANRLKIDLKKHMKNKLVPFTKEQERDFMAEIKKLTDGGMSVRSACFKLSGGDMTKMTRLQNKYQNLKTPNNIVRFKQKKLTETDINSLFLGLCKLIRRNAEDEAREKMQEKFVSTSALREVKEELDKMKKDLAVKIAEVNKLKLENQKLSTKLKSFCFQKAERRPQ